ncbi:UvrB/UvrC motif-containing protein [Treponema endosymbiont of Eucomonympha sp.]|uniref:UvrB/UvrC motif-containing protein n=1 Tax=Treponema endosymbiont of Eucomonympha sp. TaxID=1580831 RepID=UPI000750902B|nr:UvrB/UvrC motif-containing protein [Treponema endosymbiont of Eucomonympha sp.]
MYADRESPAMTEAIAETRRRRGVQEAYNAEHGITPTTVSKAIEAMLVRTAAEKREAAAVETAALRQGLNLFVPAQRRKLVKALEREMTEHADRLEYEQAAAIRDEIAALRAQFGT